MSDSFSCEHCGAGIAAEDVNVSTDIALCRACGKTMAFSSIAALAGAAEMDMSRPPKGIRFVDDPRHGKSIVHKKIPAVLIFLIPFTAAWSGFSMAGIYGTQIASGKFDPGMSLFGLPFLIGTIALVSTILFGLFGRWRVSFPPGEVVVVAEIGPLRWTRRVPADSSTKVSIVTSGWSKNGQPQKQIQIENTVKTVKFGSVIPEECRVFMAEAIRRMVQDGR